MNYDDLSKHPNLQNINPVKLQILADVIKTNQGKRPEVIISQLMNINQELMKRNMTFTSNETNIIIELLMQDMSPAERQKVNMLLSFFNQNR